MLKFWLHIDKDEQDRRFKGIGKITLPSAGRLRMRTGANPVKNGTGMRKQSMKCWYVPPPPTPHGLWWREMTNEDSRVNPETVVEP